MITFSYLEYQHRKRKTRRERFLEKMESLIPWAQLEKKIRRHYPKAGRGRHPYPLSVMLRIHCVQLSYNLTDPAMEDMLYEIDSVRRFVGLKITGPIPDESTILKFRHLDVTRAADLLHGDEQRVCGDSGYQGVDKRPEHQGREVESRRWNRASCDGTKMNSAQCSNGSSAMRHVS